MNFSRSELSFSDNPKVVPFQLNLSLSVSAAAIARPCHFPMTTIGSLHSPLAAVRFACPELSQPKALAEPIGLAFVAAGFPSPRGKPGWLVFRSSLVRGDTFSIPLACEVETFLDMMLVGLFGRSTFIGRDVPARA